MTVNFHHNQNLSIVGHTLRFHSGNPNRGENGEPKTIPMGHQRRGRLSDQCIRAALRRTIGDWFGIGSLADRTTQMKELLVEEGQGIFPTAELEGIGNSFILACRGKEETKTQPLFFSPAWRMALLQNLKTLKNEDNQTFNKLLNPLLQIEGWFLAGLEAINLDAKDKKTISDKAIDALKVLQVAIKKNKSDEIKLSDRLDLWKEEEVAQVVQYLKEVSIEDTTLYTKVLMAKKSDGKDSAKAIRAIFEGINIKVPLTIDQILFGCFSSLKTLPTIQGCFANNGAVGVHVFADVVDFLTCMDTKEKDHAGADHIAEIRLHQMLAYEYYALNVADFYRLNEAKDTDKLGTLVAALCDGIRNLQPYGGKKHGNNKYTPEIMLVEVRGDNNANNMMSAFIDPVPANGELLATACNKLINRLFYAQNGYGDIITIVTGDDEASVRQAANHHKGVIKSSWADLRSNIMKSVLDLEAKAKKDQ